MSAGFVINPSDRTVSPVEISDLADVTRIVGFDTIESDEIGNGNDRLFFDEECFIRGTSGRFRLDSLVPVAGKGIIIGVSGDGVTFSDTQLSESELMQRLRFE
ncbi:MAG: hypothetical protein KDI88_05610 [Gammaproteobacteria bacterium]|nr:hypothetical protein [Gammaproteobacteria bacterium]